MPVNTQRTRSISFSGAFEIPNVTLQLNPTPITSERFSVEIAGFFGQLAPFGLLPGGTTICGFVVNVSSHFGSTDLWLDSASVSACGNTASTTAAQLLPGLSGTFDFSVDVEEVSTYNAGHGRWGTEWDLQDQAIKLGAVTGSLTIGSLTLDCSGFVSSSYNWPLSTINGHLAQIGYAMEPSTQVLSPSTLDAAITGTVMGQAMEWAYHQVFTSPIATVDLSGGIAFSLPKAGGGINVDFNFQPTKQATISGQINTFDVIDPASLIKEWSAPDVVPAVWHPFNFGDTISLQNAWVNILRYSTTSGIGGDVTPAAFPGFQQTDGNGIIARINPQSLTNSGELHNNVWDLALNARLKPFNALTIWQDASFTLDACMSVFQWSANVSLSGGFLQVNSASMSGVATKDWRIAGKPKNTEGYRYLEIDIEPNGAGIAWAASTAYIVNDFATNGGNLYKCTTAGTSASSGGPSGTGGAITDGSVIWAFQSAWALPIQIYGQAFTNVYYWQYQANLGAKSSVTTLRYDLMAPNDSNYPFKSNFFRSRVLDCKTAINPIGPAEGPGWGIDGFLTMKLNFPTNTGTYQIREIRLVRDSAPRMTFLQSDQTQTNTYQNDQSETWGGFNYLEFALGDTDGKRSLEIWDMTTNNAPTGVSPGLGTFSNRANLINGWNVTPNASLADLSSWYGSSWLLSNLCGAGTIYTGGAVGDLWLDKPLNVNPTQLQYQARAAAVMITPQAGNISGGAGFGAAFGYNTVEFLRQRVTGVAIDTTQQPISGHTVSESEVVSGTASGTGVTNSAGRFLTGAVYAKTVPQQKAVLSGVEAFSGTLSFIAQPRATLRFGYLGKPGVPGQGWHMQDPWARLHQSVVSAGDVWYRRSAFALPAPNWLYYNQVTSYGDVVSARMEYAQIDQRVYLYITRLTAGVYSTYVAYSQSHGQDWSTPTLFMANALGATPFMDSDGYFGVCFFKYDSGSSGPGTMWITKGLDPTSLSTPYQMVDSSNNPLHIADGGWSNVVPAATNQNSMTFSPTIQGETEPSMWYSNDINRKSWTRY